MGPVSMSAVELVLLLPLMAAAQDCEATPAFLDYVRSRAAELRSDDAPAATLADWEGRRAELRRRLEAAWGGFPDAPCPLEPRVLGVLERDGYRVEKLVFQTLPGVWMTANAYVPDVSGTAPAILVVHGHWRGAKQDPVVQARCIGLAKLGFFVLAVDAFGAGERGLGKVLGEYHGDMVAATLLPTGLTLCGLQVYENRRAIDYLLTRPEVDGDRLGVTGASGGGNQSMYIGAWDERLRAVVPVCSVGNYQAYLGVACCICELVPGALEFTEQGDLLGLVAPRALMVVNATRDGVQFSVAEARKSLAWAERLYALHGCPERLQHAVFESQHDYNQEMREAMYGWMTLYLKESGDGAPIPEPEFVPEDPETLRCFPDQSRPDDFVTIPRFAAAAARRLLDERTTPADDTQRQAQRTGGVAGLRRCIFGDSAPAPSRPALVEARSIDMTGTLVFSPEPGMTLTARQHPISADNRRLAVVLDLDDGARAADGALASELRDAGWSVLTLDLRATGRCAQPHDGIGGAPDHNTAEWALWIGRPLLGQWVMDVHGLLDALQERDGRLPEDLLVAGIGPAGLVAVCAAALDTRIGAVATAGMPASYVADEPYRGWRLGVIAPGVLRDAGDVAHLAALVAPRRLLIAGGVDNVGQPLGSADLDTAYAFTRHVYALAEAPGGLVVIPDADPARLVERIERAR